MAITEDASTPAIVTTTGQTNPTTASFSPPASSLLLALVGGGWSKSPPITATIADTGSHTWTNAVAATGTDSAAGGLAQIFYTYLTTAPGSITVTATFSGWSSGTGGTLLAVRVLDGANPSQTGAATASYVTPSPYTLTTAGTISITTTTANSQVYGISDNPWSNDTYTLNSATTLLGGGAYTDSTDGISLVAWKATALTTTPGATTLGGTWSATAINNIAAFEVLPPALGSSQMAQVIGQAVARASSR